MKKKTDISQIRFKYKEGILTKKTTDSNPLKRPTRHRLKATQSGYHSIFFQIDS